MNFNHWLPASLIGAAVVMVASPVKAEFLLPTEVADIAKSTVVRIEPTIAAEGSGVLIGKEQRGNEYIYTVLTAGHVIKHSDDVYHVITPLPQDGPPNQRRQKQKVQIQERDIQRFSNLDLAILRFKSSRSYAVAKLGNSDHTVEGAGVYIAGFPNPSQAIRSRSFQFTASLVSSRLDQEAEVEGETRSANDAVVEGGYAIVYTNVTRAGMSGGPVFDVAGRVVGIHGMGDRDYVNVTGVNQETGTRIEQTFTDKIGFNLGIPINALFTVLPNAMRQFSIQYDASVPGIMPGGSMVALRGPGGTQQTIKFEEFTFEEEENADIVTLENSGVEPAPSSSPNSVQPQTQPQPTLQPTQPANPPQPQPTQPQPVAPPAATPGSFF